MKVGFFERPLVKYCEVMRKQRAQNLSAIEVYLEVAQVDFMIPLATGGVSYSVGGAAAPPTLLFATPTSKLATPTFDRF